MNNRLQFSSFKRKNNFAGTVKKAGRSFTGAAMVASFLPFEGKCDFAKWGLCAFESLWDTAICLPCKIPIIGPSVCLPQCTDNSNWATSK